MSKISSTLFPAPDVQSDNDKPQDFLKGEVVVFPMPSGSRIELFFKAPWEPRILLDGTPVSEDEHRSAREVLVWVHAHLPTLHRLLEQTRGFIGTLCGDGHVVMTELLDLRTGVRKSHAVMLSVTNGAELRLPAFVVLGRITNQAELEQRTRALFATGTVVVVCTEDDDKVLHRGQLEVGR